MILKERGNGELRPDGEIEDIGRRLSVALKDLDPRQVDQSRFVGLTTIHPDESNINRLQALRDLITQRGFFVNDQSGQSVSLFITGDSGIPFQLRNKKGQPFEIQLDDLPQFTSVDLVGTNEGGEIATQRKEQPRNTYPLQKIPEGVGFLDRILGTYQKQTNWPSGKILRAKDAIKPVHTLPTP